MLRRIYLRLISSLSRKQARRVQRVVMALRPRAKRRAALEAARTPEARLMCVAWGVTRGELEVIRDQMALLGGRHPERMVVVSNCDALFGKGGCHFEYVPARAEYERLLPDGQYDDFVYRRIQEIASAFRAQRVLALGNVDDAIIHAMARRRPSEPEAE